METTVEGAELQMRPHKTLFFFPENRETGTTVPHRAGSMELAIPWPQASITPEYRTRGVISYCRTEAMLSAAPNPRIISYYTRFPFDTLLGWPKSSFGCLSKLSQQNLNELCGQPKTLFLPADTREAEPQFKKFRQH